VTTWPRNAWYAAAWDHEVGAGLLARTICGTPVVLYRTLAGAPVALRDACPHRMLPLSMGFRTGDSIRCRYHGLKLGADGVAEEMPLKNDPVNRKVCTASFRVVDRHRLVWIWMGDAEAADPALIPDLWPCSQPDWVFDGGHYRIACDYRLLIDNLMDLTHETWVHQTSIGQLEIVEHPLETVSEGDRVFVKRWMPDIDAPPFWRSALGKPGKVDRWQICEFVAPSNVIIDVGVALVEDGATLEAHDTGARAFVIDCMTPETETSCHYFWGMSRHFGQHDRGLTGRLQAGQAGVFLEDVEVLEAQQRSLDTNPDLKMTAYEIDSGGVKARLVIKRMIAKEQPA
jgi:phenylpropionate dioxygenase-like ring-hydroxylating dioxygenase large terminal subunit